MANKIDELRISMAEFMNYKLAHILALTETLASDDIQDSVYDISDYTLCRYDRQTTSGKSKGEGLMLYIKSEWCTNITIKEKICTSDIELMVVALRPRYLPREFSNLFVVAVYCSPDGNSQNAADCIGNVVEALERHKPNSVRTVLDDLNHVKPNYDFCSYTQYVDKPQ